MVMSCLSDGILRARLDGELSQDPLQQQEWDRHLDTCADWRKRSEAMAEQADRTQAILAVLAPLPSEAPSDARITLARFQARKQLAGASLKEKLLRSRLLPAGAGLAAALFLGAILAAAPTRTWAQQILAMLRVQEITVVPFEIEAFNHPANRDRLGKTIAQLMSDKLVVTIKPGEPKVVEHPEQLGEMAGFKVRLLDSQAQSPTIKVLGEQAFQMTINLDRLQAILDEAGRSDLHFPPAVDGALIAAYVPKIVFAQYGRCSNRDEPTADSAGDCTSLAQAPSPTVSFPPSLNMAQVAEVGLQLGGMSAEAAHRFSQSIDWSSTLVLGIPHGRSYQSVNVDGVQGTLIDKSRRHEPSGSRYSLLWVKDGIIYALSGSGDSQAALTLAQSLK
jgi:hypothetical protein